MKPGAVGTRPPTTMTLAFIEAEKRKKENTMEQHPASQVVTEVTDTIPNTEKVFNYLRDEGEPRAARDIAKAIGLELNTVSACIYQLKERGLAKIVKEPGEFIKAHVEPHDIYVRKTPGRDSKPKRKTKPRMRPDTPFVAKKRTDAAIKNPAPYPHGLDMDAAHTAASTAEGVKIQISGRMYSVEEARHVYHQLHLIFGSTK